MGLVNQTTLINKDVNILKNVNLDVNKFVTSNVTLNGNLATAEASADAVPSGNGGPGTPGETFRFLIDDFDTLQNVIDTAGGGGSESTLPIPNPGDTDILNVANRRLFVEVLSDTSTGDVNTTDNPGFLNLAFNPEAFGNALAQYTSSVGAFDPTPGKTTAEIVADAIDAINNGVFPPDTFKIEITSVNLGTTDEGESATVRVNVLIEDNMGQQAITTALLTESFTAASPLQISGIIAGFVNETLAVPVGTDIGQGVIVIGTEDDADQDGNAGVNLDAITTISLFLEDRPEEPTDGLVANSSGNPISSALFFPVGSVVEERPSDSGTDLVLDLLEVEINQPGTPGDGALAETDTFAQATPDSVQSFSESLAAVGGSFDFIDVA